MQFDMFGASSESAIREASPPVMLPSGAWMQPETLAFNAALRAGSLVDAIEILKPLKTSVVVGVLLASGFSIGEHKDRKKLISEVQSSIVTAARLRMTGMELRAVRLAEKAGQAVALEDMPFDANDYALAFMPPVEVGDFLTGEDDFNYVVESTDSTGQVHISRPANKNPGEFNNSRFVRTMTADAAKIAGKRFLHEQARAVKSNASALATAALYADLIESKFEPSNGLLVRVNGLIYAVAREDYLPSANIELERVVSVDGGGSKVEVLSLSRAATFAARRAFFPDVASFVLDLAKSQVAAVEVTKAVGEVQLDVDSTVAESARMVPITRDVAANMRSGMRVVDGAGKAYQAFSARFDYLEVFPIGADGKPEVWAGNSVFFHLNPDTATASPNRRHDPVFLVSEISLANSLDVVSNTFINNAITSLGEKENANGTSEFIEPGSLRAGDGSKDRGNGEHGVSDSESLVSGLAGSGVGFVEGGDLSGSLAGAAGGGVERDGGRGAVESSFGGSRVDGVVRDSVVSARVGLNAGSARKLTRYELNGLLVTDMTDDELLQARVMFKGGRRFDAVERQIAKRGVGVSPVVVAPVESFSVVKGDGNKFTLEDNEGSILAGNGNGTPLEFDSSFAAKDFAVNNGFGVTPEKGADNVAVVVPNSVAAAISAAMTGQKSRLLRLRSAAKSEGVTLEQRLSLQARVVSAEASMHQMRLSIFDVEDAAVLAIKSGDVGLLAKHALLFPGVREAVAAHLVGLASLAGSVGSVGWDVLSASEKTGVLKRAGWITGNGDLNFVAKRLLTRAWADISVESQATIRRNSSLVGSVLDGAAVVPPLVVGRRSAEQRLADGRAVAAVNKNAVDGLLAMHGDGLDPSDDVLAIVALASAGFVPAEKAKLDAFLKETTRLGKGGTFITDGRKFFDLLPEHFALANYLLSDALNRSEVVNASVKPLDGITGVRDYGTGRLSPVQSTLLQEAHTVFGRDVTRVQVQAMRDRVAAEVESGLTNNGVGRPLNLTSTAVIERKERLVRLEHDLALFSTTQGVGSVGVGAVAVVKGLDDVSLVAAGKLLASLTRGRGDIYALAGPNGIASRVRVMATLLGRDKVTQAEAGVTAIKDEFYRRLGVNTKTTIVQAADEFRGWVGSLSAVKAVLPVTAIAAVEPSVLPVSSVVPVASIPAWHTVVPEKGVAFEAGDESLDGGRRVVSRISREAVAAVSQSQYRNGGRMNAYALPSTASEHGAARLFPRDQSPVAPWTAFGPVDGLAVGFMTKEQIVAVLGQSLQNEPVLCSGDAKVLLASLRGELLKGDVKQALQKAAVEPIEAVAAVNRILLDVGAASVVEPGAVIDARLSSLKPVNQPDGFSIDLGFMFGVVPYRASAVIKVPEGHSVFSSEIIQRKTNLSKADAEIYPLLDNKLIWRVSAVKNADGDFYSMTEVMDENYGRNQAGEVIAYFKEVRGHDVDALERLAPSVHKAAVLAWERAVAAAEPSLFDVAEVVQVVTPVSSVTTLERLQGALVGKQAELADNLELIRIGQKVPLASLYSRIEELQYAIDDVNAGRQPDMRLLGESLTAEQQAKEDFEKTRGLDISAAQGELRAEQAKLERAQLKSKNQGFIVPPPIRQVTLDAITESIGKIDLLKAQISVIAGRQLEDLAVAPVLPVAVDVPEQLASSVQAPVLSALQEQREAFVHSGVKIYPVIFKSAPGWAVQSADNRTNGKVFGDTLHSSLDDAKREAVLQVARVQSQVERSAVHQAAVDAVDARKAANKDKSIAEIRKDVILDGKSNLHPNVGLGGGSRRLTMQSAVEQGRLVAAVVVRDTAALKRDQDVIERVRRNGYLLGLSNENIPLVKDGLEAQARIKLDQYEKFEYRVFEGRDDSGTFWNISKTEFDYAQEFQKINLEFPYGGEGVPVASLKNSVPASVRDRVLWAVGQMNDVKAALVGVEKARGNGAILALEWKDQAPKLVRPNVILSDFRKLALVNGVDAERFLLELGGVPDFQMFESVAQSSVGLVVDTVASMQAALEVADPFSDVSLDLLERLQVAVSADILASVGSGNMPVYSTGNGNHVAVHPSAQKPGMFQVSRYAVDGIIGDSQYVSIEDLVRSEGLASYPRLEDAAAALVIGNAVEAEGRFESALKAQVLTSVAPVGLVESPVVVRSEYPLGKTNVEDRFYGSRVRVSPTLKGDVAWDGTVMSTLNGGRLLSVRRDAVGENEGRDFLSVRISGDRIDVLEVKDSEVGVAGQAVASLAVNKDLNIGRSWNTVHGKATITSLPYPKTAGSDQPALYEYTFDNGSFDRVYEDKIDETIARQELAALPENMAASAAEDLIFKANEAANNLFAANLESVKVAQVAKLDLFLANAGYSPLRAGQAKKTLLSNVKFEGEVMASFEFAEKIAMRGFDFKIKSKDDVDSEVEKTVYTVGDFEVGAFEYAYASYVAHLVTRDSPVNSQDISDTSRGHNGETNALSLSSVVEYNNLPHVNDLAFPAVGVVPVGEFSMAAVDVTSSDYVLTDADRIGLGSLGEKFQDNLKAIQILRLLDSEKRHAVGDELGSLARYVGWGGLKGVFDPENKQWARQHVALRELLTDVEWAAASRSQLDAFYTAPVVAKAMYSAVSRLGFESGRVLEPSVGVGNFFGLMPEGMRKNSMLHGVELDVLTSQIVAALYPSAKISKATGFQAYNVPAGYFDMAIGNPPFGSQAIVDDKGSVYSGWSIHNYFFAKSIDMLRPGGLMPMVVSHNFLDKLDPHVRQWIGRRAELVSGVRLPNSAFKENANTEVVTDVLVFRRLDYENTLGKQETPDWLDTSEISIENQKSGETEVFSINNYFINNPQNVLGTNSATGSMYRANEYTVLPNGELDNQLANWVETLPKGIYVPLERSIKNLEESSVAVAVPEFVKEGSFFIHGEQVFQRNNDRNGEQRSSVWTPPNQRALERMTGMIQIRMALRNQMKLERSVDGDNDIEAGRSELNRAYDDFVKRNGLLNDPVNTRIFREDTESALVESLEFNYEKALSPAKAEEYGVEPRPSKATKADILSRRVLFPPGEIEVVENAKDALLHSLNYTGGVNMEYMQRAYSKSQDEIVAELGDLLFTDPVEGFVTADQYLSGDVKTKLAEVSKAAKQDFSLSRNVDALKLVIPTDKLPSEIHASIGAAWIPSKIFGDFAKEISDATTSFTYVEATGHWLRNNSSTGVFAKNNDEYGTAKMGALDILSHVMNSRAPEIKKTVTVDGQERYVIDEPETELVRHRVDKIRTHWDSWLWNDGPRADQLASIYNDRFNRTVERKYDGSHLTFPGMSPTLSLLAHQKNGVWRGLQDRVMLLDQVVGAGKTYEGVALIMEMRRLGITKKPLIAVPNHLTLQWRSEFYKLYPGANVLAATPKDFEKDNRERFFSKIVTGNWDAIVVGHSSLKKISVPLEAERKIVTEQFNDISDAIESLKRKKGDRNIVRDMERIKDNLEAKLVRLKEKGGKKDNVVDFGDLGVDGLFIDEVHEFKNLYFTTQMNRVAGLGNPAGSGKAFDLFVKIRWMQETFGEKAPLITATGTPISNSLAEMYTMQRYMQYSKLKSNNLHLFDSWAKQYGDVKNVYEVAPSGTGYRLSQRFAKFKNLGSLMGEYRSFSDVVTLDNLKAQEIALGKTFPVPKLAGGKPRNIVAQRSSLQEKFFGIPEIVRDDSGQITFEVDLSLETSIVKMPNGKFAMQQKGEHEDGEVFTRLSPKFYETAEEAAYMTALGAVTPVMKIDPNSIVGQFDNLRELTRATKGKINALSLTGLANKAGLDYRLIDAFAEDFKDSKVNIAVRNIVKTAKEWEADRGVQLVFCDLSVPLSAQKKMATKEKRIYIRDDQGALTHGKGTVHTVKGLDGFTHFLMPVGKGQAKTFTIYDAYTGQLMKDGLDSKSAAHALISQLLATDSGRERWLDLREKSLVIEADEVDEYKNEHTIDADGDAADLEISRADIDGVSGASGFSIYDDMKAKLVAQGIPANEIEFIHDHDTPQAKDLLFKRVNAGDVRVLFGSTPKMGAGTNVQNKLVALHHIDAPWRPSDLEQREGRIIRRGNSFYERDPEGFEIKVNRYATAQTYDTRRWQLLEHKAAGLEQLRNYSGGSEIDDVANEASNSADMKAAASGNPLILKETQLATEMKKLQMLSHAHRDGDFMKRATINSCRNYANEFGPSALSSWETLKMQRDSAGILAIFSGVKLEDKEQVMGAVDKIHSRLDAGGAAQAIIYRGLKFEYSRDEGSKHYKMKTPEGEGHLMDVFSRTGIVTRMDNWCNGIEGEISFIGKRIENNAARVVELSKLIGKPFEYAEDLIVATAEHGKVQRALMKSNSMSAVKPEDAAEFAVAVDTQKAKLRAFGLGVAVDEIENADGGERVASAAPGLLVVSDSLAEAPLPLSLSELGDLFVASMPAAMREPLMRPSVTLKDGSTVSGKEYVDRLFEFGYLKPEYYVAPTSSYVGFLLNEETGKKARLDSTAMYYADNTIMSSLKAAKAVVGEVLEIGEGSAGVVGWGARVSVVDPVVVLPVTVPVEDMELYIKVAANSISELRKTDVFRVLVESNRLVNRDVIAAYIKDKRPDLINEVDEVMAEALAESVLAAAAVVEPVVLASVSSVVEVPVVNAVKQPWMMGGNEFRQQREGNPHFDQLYPGQDDGAYLKDAFATHLALVKEAVVQGLPVPLDVLNEYPGVGEDWAKAVDVLRMTRPLAPQRLFPNNTPVLKFIESGWNSAQAHHPLETKRLELAESLGVQVERFRKPGSAIFQLRIVSAPEAVRHATLGDVAGWKALDSMAVNAAPVSSLAVPVGVLGMPLEKAPVEITSLGINHLKTRMVAVMPVSVSANWIVMNAPRPLLGSKTMQGDFLSGRHYAAIDPDDSMAGDFIKENEKLDARVVVEVSRDTQMALALHGNEYRDRYMEYGADERYEMLSGLLEKFADMPFGELSKAILDAKGVVKEGSFSGRVLNVANGVVTQIFNRNGDSVCHDLSRLTMTDLKANDLIDVNYRNGVGRVQSLGVASTGVGR